MLKKGKLTKKVLTELETEIKGKLKKIPKDLKVRSVKEIKTEISKINAGIHAVDSVIRRTDDANVRYRENMGMTKQILQSASNALGYVIYKNTLNLDESLIKKYLNS